MPKRSENRKKRERAMPLAGRIHRLGEQNDKFSMRTSILAFAVIAAIVFITVYFKTVFTLSAHEQVSYTWPIIVCASLSLIVMVGFEAYLYFENKDILKNNKLVLTIGTLILLSTILSAFASILSFAFSAAFIAIILCGLLVSKRTAYTMVILMALISFMLCIEKSGSGCMDKSSAVAISLIVGGMVCVLMLNVSTGRTLPIISGTVGGAMASIVMAGLSAFYGASAKEAAAAAGWMFAGGLLCGIIATGLLPLFENIFDIATDARLNELMNNNNPLLKRLMMEAPGTYHHSLIVAVLAENAAELVGANALLCKTAAYYHDIGKLTGPMYFKENQGEYNIHDELSPEESAKRIIAHQRDGVAMLTKKRFPSELIKVASQHHGNSAVSYFYTKAVEKAEDQSSVKREDFVYPSEKPNTKEAAVLMLADCCEAAVRALKRPTAESITERIHTIIGNLWNNQDGQLSECPLTAKDIKNIEKCFISNLLAQYHERIEYPETNRKINEAAEEKHER